MTKSENRADTGDQVCASAFDPEEDAINRKNDGREELHKRDRESSNQDRESGNQDRESDNQTILDTDLKNVDIKMKTLPLDKSLNNSNEQVLDNKEKSIDGSLKTVFMDKDNAKIIYNADGKALEKNDGGSLKNSSEDKGGDLEKDGLIADADKENVDESLKNAPIDRGWAWAILFAAYLEVVIFGGLMKCNGIFFIAYQERFKSGASEISLILTVQNMTMSFTGIFVMTVGMKYMTARTSILIGALLQPVFYVVTAFVENIGVLYFTVGFIPGLAGAMIYLPIVSTINTYFNKYRGLANSLSMSGSSLGGLIFGPIYTALFEEYGYTGTLLILSGVMLNIMITGVLMRPIEFYTKHNKKKTYGEDGNDEPTERLIKRTDKRTPEGVSDEMSEKLNASGASVAKNSSKESAYVSEDENGAHEHSYFKENDVRSANMVKRNQSAVDDAQVVREFKHKGAAFRDLSRTVSYDPESLTNRHFPSPSLKRAKLVYHGSHSLKRTSNESIDGARKRTFSEISHTKVIHGMIESLSRSRVALYTGGDIMCGSMANISVADHDEVFIKQEPKSEENLSKSEKSNPKSADIGRVIIEFFRTVFDISLLRSYVFIHFLCFAFLVLPGSVLPSVYFAPYAKDIGITSSQIGTMFPIIGCLDMLSRIAVGFIADKKWMRPTSILCLTAIVVGTMCHLIRFFTNYGTIIIFVVIIGMTSGAYLSLYAVVLLEHIGVDQFKGALGWATMCHGVTMAAFFPVTGALRDETGTYFASFHLIGVALYLAAVLSFLLPYTSRRHNVT